MWSHPILALWYHPILATLFTVLALLLIGVILLQRGKGTGLSGAFGGAGGGTATFGSKTGDILTWITVGAATLLMLYAIVLNFLFRPLTTAPGAPPPTGTTPGTPPAGNSWHIDEFDSHPAYASLRIFGENDA